MSSPSSTTAALRSETAEIRVLPASACMITALVQQLTASPDQMFDNMTVILPTQRLCTAFLARLAEQRGACFAPETWTMEQFVATLAGPDSPPVLPETERILLVRSLLVQRVRRHVKERHAGELVQFFGEIEENGMGVQAFALLKKFWQEDPYHHEQHVGSIIDRIDEIEGVYLEWNQLLERAGFTTWSRKVLGSAPAIAAKLRMDGPNARAAYHVAAFTSISPALGEVLDALCMHAGVSFWLSASPELYGEVNPIKHLTAELIRRGARIVALPPPRAVPEASLGERETLIIRCPSRIDEVAAVLDRYEQLVRVGVTPARIAILVTNETVYGPMLRAAVAARGITANLAVTQPLSETAAGLWLEALGVFLRSGEALVPLMALAAHPVTLHFVETWSRTTPGEASAGATGGPPLALRLLAHGARFKATHGLESFINECEDAPVRAALLLLRDALAPLCRRDGEPLSLASWLEIFQELITRFDPLAFIAEEDIARSAAAALQSFTGAVSFVAALAPVRMSPTDFWTIVEERLCSCDVRRTGEPLSGLQVLSLAQARYMPFDCAMILGCNEGVFPQALPKDELIDDFLKRQVGLPGWRALEAREDLTFLLLRARLARLVLTYAASDLDEPLVRSRFVEKLVSEESLAPLFYAGSQAGIPALAVKSGEGDALLEGGFPAAPDLLLGEFSATSLTCLLRCPYQFLLHRLGLRELEFASVDDQAVREGILLHQIMETFFTGKLGKQILAEPWPAALDDGSFRTFALARLERLSIELGGANFAATPLGAHMLTEGWLAWVGHLVAIYGPQGYGRIAGAQKEQDFAADFILPGASPALHERRRLIGRIDSIDESRGLVVLTDYKRSRVPGQKECADGSAPQLLFYHMALAKGAGERDAQDYLLGYYSVIEGKWYPRAVGSRVRLVALQRGLITAKTPGLDELYTAMLRRWRHREERILREGRFFADNSSCELCSYPGLCRKAQAGISERLQRQALWCMDGDFAVGEGDA